MAAEDWIDLDSPEPFDSIEDPYDFRWTTRDGKSLRISDMTDVHLMNAVLYLERTRRTQHPGYELMIDEIEDRGLNATLELMRQPAVALEFDNKPKPTLGQRFRAAARAFRRGR